jgi:hypothetical protein
MIKSRTPPPLKDQTTRDSILRFVSTLNAPLDWGVDAQRSFDGALGLP